MDYEQFKAHLANFSWKPGDAPFIAALDGLITMANSSINRDLRIERRHAITQLGIIAEDTPLPADYDAMRSVTSTDEPVGVIQYAEPSVIYNMRNQTTSRSWMDIYSLVGKVLLLVGPADVDSPFNIDLSYRTLIPDFQDTDTSWVADEYLDLYTYAVLKHSGMYLREDARMQSWSSLYQEAIDKLNENSAFEQTRGVPRSMPLPRVAGIQRGRGRNSRGKLSGW